MNCDHYINGFVVKGKLTQVAAHGYHCEDDEPTDKVYQVTPSLIKNILKKIGYCGAFEEILECGFCVFTEIDPVHDQLKYYNLNELEIISEQQFYDRKINEIAKKRIFNRFDL